MARKKTVRKEKRLPPRHKLTLEESIERLGLTGITHRKMFGGLCYYANGHPFSFLIEEDLALKLPAMKLVSASAAQAGELFHPGGGDFVMREYLSLSQASLSDEEKIDALVGGSYEFVSIRKKAERGLSSNDLAEGRNRLYHGRKEGWRGRA